MFSKKHKEYGTGWHLFAVAMTAVTIPLLPV